MPLRLWLPAVLAWLATGLAGLGLIAAGPAPAPLWVWVAAALPVGATLPFMLAGKPNAYLAALFGSIAYACVALTEAVANPAVRPWAAGLAAGSLLAFFLLIAVVRAQRGN